MQKVNREYLVRYIKCLSKIYIVGTRPFVKLKSQNTAKFFIYEMYIL